MGRKRQLVALVGVTGKIFKLIYENYVLIILKVTYKGRESGKDLKARCVTF